MAQNVTLHTSPMIYVEWKINNFCNLRRKPSYSIKSSSFTFEGANWNLEIFPNGEYRFKTFSWIGLYLNKEHSSADYRVCYCIGIKTTDGSELEVVENEDVFQMFYYGMGTNKLIKRSTLLKTEHGIAPDGSVTVFCTIRIINGSFASPLVQISTAQKPGISSTAATVESASQTSSPGLTVETASQTLIPAVTAEAVSQTSSTAATVEVASQTSSTVTTLENEPYILSTAEQHAKVPSESDGISTLFEDLKNMYMNRSYSDITILVQNKEFSAHRNNLVSRSPVFASMFEHEFAEKNSGKVKISDCDPDSFEQFLLFLYIGKVDVLTVSKAVHLYTTADKYDVKELKEECIRCMVRDVSVDSFCDVIHLAVMHNDSELLNAATDFFISNVATILPTTKWQDFLEDNSSLCNELLIKVMESKK